jgi:hypothetical protein
MKKKDPTISVAEYARAIGVSPQVVYNRIATGKLKEGKDWMTRREVKTVKRIIKK